MNGQNGKPQTEPERYGQARIGVPLVGAPDILGRIIERGIAAAEKAKEAE